MQISFVGMGIVLCIAVPVPAGCPGAHQACKTPPGPTVTPVREGHVVADESRNGAAVCVNRNAEITVKLNEDPTTGYQWNLTASPGLTVTTDTFVSSGSSGKLVGAGGTRSRDLTASGTGMHTIHAVYRRSWEPVTGNETVFTLTMIVE